MSGFYQWVPRAFGEVFKIGSHAECQTAWFLIANSVNFFTASTYNPKLNSSKFLINLSRKKAKKLLRDPPPNTRKLLTEIKFMKTQIILKKFQQKLPQQESNGINSL